MGWGSGVLADGREVGYNVEAVCEHEPCAEDITRGLHAVCGGMHEGAAFGCGRYFCGEHLFFTTLGQLCPACSDAMDRHCIRCRREPVCTACSGLGTVRSPASIDDIACPRCNGRGGAEAGLAWHLVWATYEKLDREPAGIVCGDCVDDLDGDHEVARHQLVADGPFPGTSRELLQAATEREESPSEVPESETQPE